MKRILMIFLMFVPFIANAGSDLDIRNQMLDSEIERLTKQRDEKYDALKKCEKSTQGFKIAGITTLVATGIGIYGNIKLSEKLKGKKTGGVNGLNTKKLTPKESINQMCEEDCPSGYSEEQCDKYNDCWKTQSDCNC